MSATTAMQSLGNYLGTYLTRAVAIACVLGLLAAGGVWFALAETERKTAVAYFPQTIGLYEGNTVRVLGVEMGIVEAVEPEGERVKVSMSYDADVAVPEGAEAVVVAPSLVSDRFVQLTPAYTGGAELADGAVIPEERTAVPLEIDDLYESTNRVAEALGPDGANEAGSLSDLITTLSENLDGQGENLNQTVTDLGELSRTLEGNSAELFGTVENLAEFTTTIADSDDEVRQFQQQLADVSGFLADERENLGLMVEQLGIALDSVHRFVEDNHEQLHSNVDKLADITDVLVDQRAELAEFLDVAPTALNNVINSYNATGGTLDTRGNFNELTMSPLTLLCYGIERGPEQGEDIAELCDGITSPFQGQLPSPAEQINSLQAGELPLPATDQLDGLPQQGGDR